MSLPVLTAERLVLRPIAEADLDRLVAIVGGSGVVEWWAGDPAEMRSDIWSDGEAFVVEIDGAVAGWLVVSEELSAGYRHAALDIMLAPEAQDRGLGSEALRLAIRWLIDERRHHRFTIDPAVANERAVRAYAAVGFRPVGVMRRYERGADGRWHDNLLMDLLAEEFVMPGSRD